MLTVTGFRAASKRNRRTNTVLLPTVPEVVVVVITMPLSLTEAP
jgi:hypothetical protein